jgi:hypothetical protein
MGKQILRALAYQAAILILMLSIMAGGAAVANICEAVGKRIDTYIYRLVRSAVYDELNSPGNVNKIQEYSGHGRFAEVSAGNSNS